MEKEVFLCNVTWKMFRSATFPGATGGLASVWCAGPKSPGKLHPGGSTVNIFKVYDFK